MTVALCMFALWDGADGSRGRALKTEMAGSVLSFPRKYAKV